MASLLKGGDNLDKIKKILKNTTLKNLQNKKL